VCVCSTRLARAFMVRVRMTGMRACRSVTAAVYVRVRVRVRAGSQGMPHSMGSIVYRSGRVGCPRHSLADPAAPAGWRATACLPAARAVRMAVQG
jgi:hypothetical protein